MMSTEHFEIGIELPHDPYSTIHLHLTLLSTFAMVFVTNNAPGESGTSTSAMGSFVYSMPVAYDLSKEPICTTLFVSPPSIDFATRLAKILTRQLRKPVYVGCSLDLVGVSWEDEMESLKAIVNQVDSICQKQQ